MSDLIKRSLSAQIEVGYSVDRDIPAVLADPNQLELALLNLCVNARDAMPDGGKLEITVRKVGANVAPRLGPGRYVCVSVSDTGAGMDRETLQRAVEPFFTTKDVGRGTGLGLSMVHGLAAQSGGLFQLESEVGQGTRASIYLPVVDIDVEPRPQIKRDTGLAKEPLRILLVDDEDLVRVGTAEMLEALGHEVRQAASGPGAVQILRASGDFDLLIADYMMPGMSGVSLVREAQQLKPQLPALLITGYAALDPQSDDGLARLGKPFGQAELDAAIGEVMMSSRRSAIWCTGTEHQLAATMRQSCS